MSHCGFLESSAHFSLDRLGYRFEHISLCGHLALIPWGRVRGRKKCACVRARHGDRGDAWVVDSGGHAPALSSLFIAPFAPALLTGPIANASFTSLDAKFAEPVHLPPNHPLGSSHQPRKTKRQLPDFWDSPRTGLGRRQQRYRKCRERRYVVRR